VVKTTQLVDFLIVPQIRNRIFVTSGYPILFLSSLYYESKFKARVIPTMLWITFPDRKKGPGRPVNGDGSWANQINGGTWGV